MGLRSFDEGRIKSAEVLQLIVLYNLFSKSHSKDLVFQGGTALRWFHGNDRFSEDLDFVTPLDRAKLVRFLKIVEKGIKIELMAQFGPGIFSIRSKDTGRVSSLTAFVEFTPERSRQKTMVKLEFEHLREGMSPDQEQIILSTAPAVSYFIRTGAVMLPAGRVVNVETPAEIFSDKIRALLERGYVKGRDLYDVWFMKKTLGLTIDIGNVRRKLEMYEHPFGMARRPGYFIELMERPTGENAAKVWESVDRDLSRFIHASALGHLRKNGFEEIFKAVGETFRELEEKGLDLSHYER